MKFTDDILKSPENSEEIKVDCSKCGGLEECETMGFRVVVRELYSKPYKVWEKCPKREKLETELKYQKALRTSGLSPQYQKKTFENFEVGVNINAVNSIKKYLNEKSWQEGKGLILIGGVGTGKTHLASAIVHELARQDVFALFIFVPDFLDEIRAMYDENYDEEEDKFELVKNARVLVLDDLGTERITDWAREKITQLINHRYNNALATIVTTNLTLDELKNRIGERAYSRLIGMSEVVPVLGEDWRVKNVYKRKNQG